MSPEAKPQHHRYGASKIEAVMLCAGKTAMEDGFENTTNVYAQQGSAEHYLGAKCLLTDTVPNDYRGQTIFCLKRENGSTYERFESEGFEHGSTILSKWKVDSEMIGKLNLYVNEVRRTAVRGDLFVEQRVEFSKAIGVPEAFGTADAVVVSNRGQLCVVIYDYKGGRAPVEQENNPQLFTYALGVRETLGPLYDDFSGNRMFMLYIIQPGVNDYDVIQEGQDNHFLAQIVGLDQLEAFQEQVRAAVARSEEARSFFGRFPSLQYETFDEWAKEYLNPTERGCKYCLAKATCPALAEQMVSYVLPAPSADDMDFIDLPAKDFAKEIKSAVSRVPTMDFDTVAKCFGAIKQFEAWLSAIESRMLAELLAGNTHPDFKLVKGRQGNREWTDPQAVEDLLIKSHVKSCYVYDKKLVSPTTAEANLASARPPMWKRLQKFIVRKDGKPAVAPISDKRDAIIIKPVLEDMPFTSDDAEPTNQESFEDLV